MDLHNRNGPQKLTFSPDNIEKLARARADLRMGVPVVVSDGVILAVETLSAERLHDLCSFGEAQLAITDWRARTLKVQIYDQDLARIALPRDVKHGWVRSMADPADDLNMPMKGPHKVVRDGKSELARAGIHLAKASRLLPAVLCLPLASPAGFAHQHDLTMVDTATVMNTQLSHLDRVVHARLPLTVSEAGRLHVFRPEDGAEEHYAVEIGSPDRSKPILARLHSACFTGDLLGSLKCDCGPQLRGALAQMGSEGEGILLYLNQEGRGIGLTNKMRAYALQDQGFDTVEANHRLGFEDDERDFRIGAEILRKLGFSSVRLMTNNPAKIARMEGCGLSVVERVPLQVGENRFNEEYLRTKAAKSGHLL